jgi:hypothetical protein
MGLFLFDWIIKKTIIAFACKEGHRFKIEYIVIWLKFGSEGEWWAGNNINTKNI